MTKTAREILDGVVIKVDTAQEGELLKPIIDQALKEIEAIIVQAKPGTWVDPDDTDDLEWQGYVKGVQDYKDNLRQALYGKESK